MIAGLPYDAEVEWLYSSGGRTAYVDSPYIDVGIPAGLDVGVEVVARNSQSNSGSMLSGSLVSSGNGYWGVYNYNGSNYKMWGIASIAIQIDTTSFYTYRSNFLNSKHHVVIKDGVTLYDSELTGSPTFNSGNVWLMLDNKGAYSHYEVGEIWCKSARYSIGNEIVRDFIPVRFTNEQGVSEGAMYDRVSRKLFRNAGTGAFTVGPDVATPVMGLHFMPKPVLSARNYVQDGLVAMWDGIENVGWGTHDPNATTWKDLSGNGFDLTVDQGSVVWHGNHVDPVDANAANHVYRENARSEMAALGVSPVTVEAVFYNPYVNGSRVLSCLTYQNRYNAFVGYYNAFGLGGALRDVPKGSVVACSSSLTSMLVNGNDAGAVVYTSNMSGVGRAYDDISMFGVRYINGDAQYPISCSLYALRVYASDLSTSDRIANYAVDKERFNLP